MSPRIGSHSYLVAAPHHQSSTSSSDDESTECVHRGFLSKKELVGSAMPMSMTMMGDDIWWQMNQEFACSSSSSEDEDDAYCMIRSSSRKAARPQPSSPTKKNAMTSIPEDAWMALNHDFSCEHHYHDDDEEMEDAPRAKSPGAVKNNKGSVPAAEGDWGVWWE